MADTDNFEQRDALASIVGGDDLLPAVTPATVAEALKGFTLPLAAGRDMEWLAIVVRRALALTLNDSAQKKSNAEVRDELALLAGRTSDAWLKVMHRSRASDDRLWAYAVELWGRQKADASDGPVHPHEPLPHISRFQSALSELAWLTAFLTGASATTRGQRGPWRSAQDREQRIERGQYLAIVFEAAFAEQVTANNYPNDARHKKPTAFMDFYDRVVRLAFPPIQTANLAEVTKEARNRHRKQPAELDPFIFPGIGGAKHSFD